MGFCQTVDREQLFNLLTGMLGIYILYFIAGILHESIVKRPHYNRFTNNYEICENTAGMVFIPFVTAWVMGEIYNKIFLTERVKVPHKNSAMAAFAVLAATYFSILAIQRTSFPVVIMFESCSILPVVFIGVFCSRVHDPNLHLGPQKIIVALIITAGILTFQFADPQTRQREFKDSFIGIIFLVFHFVAEGFLPDLQAEIKVNFKPAPTEMMADINKWCAAMSLVVSVVTLSGWSFVVFMWEHIGFSVDLIVMSVISGFGQFFVYRMIKQFKQHFVPFTISSRKILTATISIVFYGHQTNWVQIFGISVVLFTVFIEFLIEITKKEKNTANKDIIHQLNEEKFEEDVKSSQDGSQSKEGDIKSAEFQMGKSEEKSIRKEENQYRLKNQLKDGNEEFNVNEEIKAADNRVNGQDAGYKAFGTFEIEEEGPKIKKSKSSKSAENGKQGREEVTEGQQNK